MTVTGTVSSAAGAITSFTINGDTVAVNPSTGAFSYPMDVTVGGTYLFRYPADDDPAVLLRVDEQAVVAFSQKCTHLGCVVYYEAEARRWHCPCHEGNFEAITGDVISGPPTRPLGRIDVEVRDDGQVWALGARP